MPSKLRDHDQHVEHPLTHQPVRVSKANWNPHDGKAAQARRRRQMTRGMLPPRCVQCDALTKPGREPLLCDTCLEEKWK